MDSALPELVDVELPGEITITSLERNTIGETNDVFYCRGRFHGRLNSFFLKISKESNGNLAHERAVLERLESSEVPVPRVLGFVGTNREVLILEALPGSLIWDHIDPRRKLYSHATALTYLEAYGACLAQIHNLPADGPEHRRPRLYDLMGEENISDDRFQRLVSWTRLRVPQFNIRTFVHGDLNTASVLLHDGRVTGVLDWEFAGLGWREYDLAWLLRARMTFLNTDEEREAILKGYGRYACYDQEALRYCEVLNYLHFAGWCRISEPEYMEFALQKAERLTRTEV